MTNDILYMTKEDFNNIPYRKSRTSTEELFDSLVLIPSTLDPDADFRDMIFVGCIGSKPICRLNTKSELLFIDGLFGKGEYNGEEVTSIPPKGWCIDCLPCGYLRLFCRKKIKVGWDAVNFLIFAVDKTENL